MAVRPTVTATPTAVGPNAETAATGAGEILNALQADDPARAAALAAETAKQGDATAMFVAGLLEDCGAGTRIDHDAALQWVEKAAATLPMAGRYLYWRATTGFAREKPDAAAAERWKKALAEPVTIDARLGRWVRETDQGLQPSFQRAFLWMTDQAEAGNPVAQANLAEAYLATEWTRPDRDKHLYWLRKAGVNRDGPSLDRLAMYYALGLFVAADPVQAEHYLRLAAEAGDADAEFSLGKKYRDGDGVPASAPEAAKWLRLAALQDNVSALNALADLLRSGATGLEPDRIEALRLSRRAVELGSVDAMVTVAGMLRDGIGTEKDPDAAARLLQEAAEKGNAVAATNLGWMVARGQGGKPDLAAALQWYTRGAKSGDAGAMRLLGNAYLEGQGTEQNAQLGFEWIEKSARAGDAWAQNQMGWLLREGKGIERDDEEAVTWFRLAAKKGVPLAEANLGFHYLSGRGVAKDVPEAVRHLLIAVRASNDPWTRLQFMSALHASHNGEVVVVKGLLDGAADDQHLLDAPGSLPDDLVNAYEMGPNGIRDYARRDALLQQLANSSRDQSALLVARHYFWGAGLPYDVHRARATAEMAAKLEPNDVARFLAEVDSVAAAGPEAREDARARLHELAEHGDAAAAMILTDRYVDGIGEPCDLAEARRYFALARKNARPGPEPFEAYLKARSAIPQEVEPAKLEKLRAAQDPHQPNHRPIAVYQQAPVYPFELRMGNVQGRALIDFVVDKEGVPKNVYAIESTHVLFGLAAERAVRTWRFIPGAVDGKPVNTHMQVPIVFNLND